MPQELVLALIAVGSPDQTWFRPDIHGTAFQRRQAFDVGHNQGANLCTDEQFLAQFAG